MELKSWVRAARGHKKLTQTQLGDHLGVTKGNVSAWENGHHEPSFGQLTAIAEFTGYPLLANDVQAMAPPPVPPPNFADRRQVTDSDWQLLEDIKMVLSEEQLDQIQRQASQLDARYRQQISRTLRLSGDKLLGGLDTNFGDLAEPHLPAGKKAAK